MKTKVSVITTFYNAQQFILNAINSVLQQKVTDKNIEIEYILVDDQSTDQSLDIVNEFLSRMLSKLGGSFPNYLSVQIIQPDKNLGCGGARKYGIDHATGKYLMFLDADDYYINHDFVERAVHDIEKNNADIVEYGLIFNFANGDRKQVTSQQQINIENTEAALIMLFKDNYIRFNVWTKIIRKSLADKYPYSERRTFEDVETIPVWVSMAKKITIMPTVEINYRANQSSIIREKIIDTRLGTISAIATHFERFKDHKSVLMAMYKRAMIDLTAMLDDHNSDEEGFNEMSKFNTYMLKYIYPDTWQDITFNLPEDQ